ncbi:hypothetical protein ACFXJ8_35650 [Nonomuraea sp. NPDC059194]|uniref:hypothetical protein n=1 Tax=Nonomuraea sp. NPDC059194 TaxID=3346764 RepID=UPI0036AC9ABF
MDPVIVHQLGNGHPLSIHLDDVLTDQKNGGASAHTVRAYRGDSSSSSLTRRRHREDQSQR